MAIYWPRIGKRFLVALFYLLILGSAGYGLFAYQTRPLCTDKIQNGTEEGVDCGIQACGISCVPSLEPLMVQDVNGRKTPAGDYDIAALVTNPNSEYGSGKVDYEWYVYDGQYPPQNQEVIPGRAGTFYILPGQTKYVVLTSLRINDPADPQYLVAVGLRIVSVEWQKILGDPSEFFKVSREAFSSQENSATYEAVILNQSDFDFDTVDVAVVVPMPGGGIAGTNITNIETFASKTERSVKMTWPFSVPTIFQPIVEVGTNVFDNDNFLKRNGTQERFQQYY